MPPVDTRNLKTSTGQSLTALRSSVKIAAATVANETYTPMVEDAVPVTGPVITMTFPERKSALVVATIGQIGTGAWYVVLHLPIDSADKAFTDRNAVPYAPGMPVTWRYNIGTDANGVGKLPLSSVIPQLPVAAVFHLVGETGGDLLQVQVTQAEPATGEQRVTALQLSREGTPEVVYDGTRTAEGVTAEQIASPFAVPPVTSEKAWFSSPVTWIVGGLGIAGLLYGISRWTKG
jgi:hypothetical protein